jgi:hypothetical protein
MLHSEAAVVVDMVLGTEADIVVVSVVAEVYMAAVDMGVVPVVVVVVVPVVRSVRRHQHCR